MTVLVLAALAACAQPDGPAGPGSARTRVLLTDAPFPFDLMGSVDIHIVSIEAAATLDRSGAVEWVSLVTPDRRFNVLALRDGETALLGEAYVRITEYSAIRMRIRTYLSGITFAEGSPASVEWMGPPTRMIEAAIAQPDLPSDGDSIANLIVDFDVGRSFGMSPVSCDSLGGSCAGVRPTFRFQPWIRAVNEAATGTVSGTVRRADGLNAVVVPVPDARITLYRDGDPPVVAAMARATAGGRYRIPYVTGGGPYVVEARAPVGTAGGIGSARDVVVTPGRETVVDVALTGDGVGAPGARLRVTGPAEMDVGAFTYLFAAVSTADGDTAFGAEVTWRQSDPEVARIAGGAHSMVSVLGLAVGATTVVATGAGLADSMRVVVGGTGASVASVDVTPPQVYLTVGDSVAFAAVLRDSAGRLLAQRTVTWSVFDPERLAILRSFGHQVVVRAAGEGTTVLIATSEGKEDVAVVNVAK